MPWIYRKLPKSFTFQLIGSHSELEYMMIVFRMVRDLNRSGVAPFKALTQVVMALRDE